MMEAFFVVVSTLLYKCPRGGLPYGYQMSSLVASLIWALVLAFGCFMLTSAQWIYFPLVVIWFMLGETRMLWASYGPHPEARQGHKPLMMALCGMSLLNPFYGFIYQLAYKKFQKFPLGWTGAAELINGFIISFIMLSLFTSLF